MKFNQFTTTSILIIIFSFIFVFAYIILSRIFLEGSLEYLNSAIGAFMGAFFAFLFIRLSDFFTRIHERQRNNYNALVKLEHFFIDCGNIISANIFVINDFVSSISTAKKEGRLFVSFNRLDRFPIPKEILLELINIDFINEVATFYTHLDKMNGSCDASNRMQDTIQNAFIQKNLTPDNYLENINILYVKLQELKKFLEDLNEENIRIASITRVLLKEKSLLTTWMSLFMNMRFNKKMEVLAQDEVKILKKEIEYNQAKSRERIEKILRN